MKRTKRIQPSFLVFILLFAFLLCSCNQGIPQSPEQTEAQIQKGEMSTTEESKTEEEKLFEEYKFLHETLNIYTLEQMAYSGLRSGVCRLKDEILEAGKILPEHLKRAEELLSRLERFQNAAKKNGLFPSRYSVSGRTEQLFMSGKGSLAKNSIFPKIITEDSKQRV